MLNEITALIRNTRNNLAKPTDGVIDITISVATISEEMDLAFRLHHEITEICYVPVMLKLKMPHTFLIYGSSVCITSKERESLSE